MSDFEHILEKNTRYNRLALQNGVSQNDELVVGYNETEDLLQDAILIIDKAKEVAYHAVNVALIQRNWLLGHRIDVEILHGEQRADYGEAVINKLALDLTSHCGKGFDASNLYKFLQFSRLFPEILDAARLKSLSLTWSHYRSLLRVDNKGARDWYLKEAANQMWSTRTLDRNIASQYYYRLRSIGFGISGVRRPCRIFTGACWSMMVPSSSMPIWKPPSPIKQQTQRSVANVAPMAAGIP